MKDISAITGAEYAERLLAVNSPTRLIDHLIEKLAAKTETGWESNLLEFKGSYHKRPGSDDPDPPDYFEWNVMHAFIALANAQGGCVVIGIAETDDHQLVPGDWDPDGILGCRDADGDGKPIPGREEKDLVDHVYGVFFKEKFKRNGRTYKFATQNKRNLSALPVAHEFTLDAETLCKLSKLVTFYPCHSERCSCNALAAIVHPVKKDDDLIEVLRKEKNLSEHVVFYRDVTAKTCELTKHRDIRNYEENREPASSDYLVELKTPLSRSVETSDIYTTMRSYDPNFVGRQKEIDAIRKICTGGKIVLVHAPGGTGKTELALKFAAEDAAQYPGGSFYVPAETAKTWSDILRNLLDWKTSTTGITPEEWLGLVSSSEQVQQQSANRQKDSQGKSIAKPIYGDSDIVNALIRKTLDRGPMLLVLDNVEAPGDLLATRAIKKVFQQGLPQGLHIIATARNRKGVTDRTCCETTMLSLGDVSTDDALAIINGAKEFESADEKEAARKIIDILDHRALYVARIANLKNDFAERSFSRLHKKLLHDKLEVVKPTSDGDDPRTPTVLWQWAKQAIDKSDNSGKCIKLLQTIALFPADGMSTDLLEYFWYSDFGKLDPPATLAAYKEDPDLFKDDLLRIDAFSLIQKDSTSNTLRMHRLDRAAIRRDLDQAKSSFRTHIGEVLHDCPIFPSFGWTELAQLNSDLIEFCPLEVLDGETTAFILSSQPKLKNQFSSWDNLNFDDWQELIFKRPEFARLPECEPQFISPGLLGHHPELLPLFNMHDLNGQVWSAMLRTEPSLSEHCPWERLKKADWLSLLRKQPHFIREIPHPKELYTTVQHSYVEFSGPFPAGLNNSDWGDVLKEQPSLSESCQWDKLDKSDWVLIISKAPHLLAKAPETIWDNLTGHDWTKLLSKQPALFKHLQTSIHLSRLTKEINWTEILKHQPIHLGIIPFSDLSDSQWLDLIYARPQLAERNPPWNSIANYLTKNCLWEFWITSLQQVHAAIDKLVVLRPVEDRAKQRRLEDLEIIKAIEELDKRCSHCKTHEQHCAKHASLHYASHAHRDASQTQSTIKESFPNFKNFFDPNFSERNPTKPLRERPIYETMIVHPKRLKFQCEGNCIAPNLKYSDGTPVDNDVINELEDYRLPFIYDLLVKCTTPDCDAFTLHKHSMNGLTWAALLCIRKEFASACDWTKINGKELCLLMINRPSLREHCNWSKFGGLEWSVLLAENPEFAENCNAHNGWAKFSDADWQYLLDERPWMSKYRPTNTDSVTSPSRTI